VIGNWGEVVTR